MSNEKLYGKYTHDEFNALPEKVKFTVVQDYEMGQAINYVKSGNFDALFSRFGNFSFYGYTATNMLDFFYDCIPDKQKYNIVIDVYTNAKCATKRFSKYIKDIKKYRPINYVKSIKQFADEKGNITVYRGGTDTSAPPNKGISWSIERSIAEFFAYRFQCLGIKGYVYSGEINIKDVIAYTNDREEYEILQYKSVKNIVLLPEDGRSAG
jgi:hypothetical protein